MHRRGAGDRHYSGKDGLIQKITPHLWYDTQAGEAAEQYTAVFASLGASEGETGIRSRRTLSGTPSGDAEIVDISLLEQSFTAMDSGYDHGFSFNEAVSLLVKCETQEEIDRLWGALSASPEAEQCGWLKDPYGVSWQIVPSAMDRMMREGDADQMARVTAAFLQMKKFDIAALEEAYDG